MAWSMFVSVPLGRAAATLGQKAGSGLARALGESEETAASWGSFCGRATGAVTGMAVSGLLADVTGCGATPFLTGDGTSLDPGSLTPDPGSVTPDPGSVTPDPSTHTVHFGGLEDPNGFPVPPNHVPDIDGNLEDANGNPIHLDALDNGQTLPGWVNPDGSLQGPYVPLDPGNPLPDPPDRPWTDLRDRLLYSK
jgi:hypothetical protein